MEQKLNLIFEGVDCAGKSSLIKAFNKDRNFKEKTTPRPIDMVDGMKIYKDFVRDVEEGNFIFDRGPMSEVVYAPKYRGYYPDYMLEVFHEIESTNSIFVIVKADIDIIKSRFDYDYASIEDLERIQDGFLTLATGLFSFRSIEVDTSNRTVEESVKILEKQLEERYGITEL